MTSPKKVKNINLDVFSGKTVILSIGSIYIFKSTKHIYLPWLHIAGLTTRLILLTTPVSTFCNPDR
jgi:hypothetical protein